MNALPAYDRQQTYAWNYDHAPAPPQVDVPVFPGSWTSCGKLVPSPLGIAAGPLLNGRWVLYYAALGFDVLTYKTVRSGPRECYPWPNLQPVACGNLLGGERDLRACDEMRGSWAVAFGMPSQSPDVWRADVEHARRQLPAEKLLSVSVVGTVQPGWSLAELAADYARCAQWAVDSGANAIEANFSCPNVSTCDGQLYQHPADAGAVAAAIRSVIDGVPLVIKVGQITSPALAHELIAELSPHASALAMTNSIATTVVDAHGRPMFNGERRGICGKATFAASLAQTALVAGVIREQNSRLTLIGVGGASTAADVRAYLAAGAEQVHLATTAMTDPAVALRIRREWT